MNEVEVFFKFSKCIKDYPSHQSPCHIHGDESCSFYTHSDLVFFPFVSDNCLIANICLCFSHDFQQLYWCVMAWQEGRVICITEFIYLSEFICLILPRPMLPDLILMDAPPKIFGGGGGCRWLQSVSPLLRFCCLLIQGMHCRTKIKDPCSSSSAIRGTVLHDYASIFGKIW